VTRYTANLFADILVPLSGDDDCWDALEQAILIAQREGARLHGLHIVETIEEVESQAARAVRERFNRTCAEAEVVGSLAVEAGTITKKICERAGMTDLVVLKLVHPPAGGLYSLKSQFRALIVNSSRPMLGVPSGASPLKRALLAYDDSPRAREAMFVAAYLAEVWKTGLTVFTAEAGILHRNAVSIQDHARRYLELHEVQAEYIFRGDAPMVALAETAAERKADLVLMGGYGGPFLREVVTGSTLDAFLWVSSVPTFICR
jgi:nucleotide-binding universal stress UspA family protein